MSINELRALVNGLEDAICASFSARVDVLRSTLYIVHFVRSNANSLLVPRCALCSRLRALCLRTLPLLVPLRLGRKERAPSQLEDGGAIAATARAFVGSWQLAAASVATFAWPPAPEE